MCSWPLSIFAIQFAVLIQSLNYPFDKADSAISVSASHHRCHYAQYLRAMFNVLESLTVATLQRTIYESQIALDLGEAPGTTSLLLQTLISGQDCTLTTENTEYPVMTSVPGQTEQNDQEVAASLPLYSASHSVSWSHVVALVDPTITALLKCADEIQHVPQSCAPKHHQNRETEVMTLMLGGAINFVAAYFEHVSHQPEWMHVGVREYKRMSELLHVVCLRAYA